MLNATALAYYQPPDHQIIVFFSIKTRSTYGMPRTFYNSKMCKFLSLVILLLLKRNDDLIPGFIRIFHGFGNKNFMFSAGLPFHRHYNILSVMAYVLLKLFYRIEDLVEMVFLGTSRYSIRYTPLPPISFFLLSDESKVFNSPQRLHCASLFACSSSSSGVLSSICVTFFCIVVDLIFK